MDYSNYRSDDKMSKFAIDIFPGSNSYNYPSHWHSYGEIILVGPGDKNVFKVNQKEYCLVEGDFVLIWPTEMHSVVEADLKNALIIQFSNAFINSMFDMQRILHYYHDLHVLCIMSHPELVRELNKIALQMRDIYFADAEDKEIRCCMLLMEFMLILDRHREDFKEDIGAEARNHYPSDVMQRITSVADYIKNHLTDEDLSQATMAERAGISKDYFSRIFKNVTGMNYSKWLNMIRLEKAINLLSNESLTLTEVALLSGFQSIPSFNRVFREDKGMSPSEYRNLYNSTNQPSEQ